MRSPSLFLTRFCGVTNGYRSALLVGALSLVIVSTAAAEAMRVPISLDEAIALAIQNSLDLEVARFGPEIAREERLGAWGEYDPEFVADLGYEKREEPNTFSLNAISKLQDRTIDGGVGLEALVPYLGARVGVEFDSGRTQTNSILEGFTPRYDSGAFLTASIPLAKDLIWNRPWTELKLGALREESAVERLRGEIMDVIEDVVVAYWALHAREAERAVAIESLATAEALLVQMEERFEIGTGSQVEVFEARAGAAERRLEFVESDGAYEAAVDVLSRILLGAEFSDAADWAFLPTDDPTLDVSDVEDFAEDLPVALQSRPSIRLARHAIEDREVELRFARNQRLPRFDVDVRYGFVGVSGKNNPRVSTLPVAVEPSPALRGGYGDSYDDLFSDSGAENLEVRGSFSIPIPNTQARRAVRRDEFRLRRAESARVRAREEVAFELREAVRAVRTALESIAAAEERVVAAGEQYRAESVRLEHGESKPFDVLLRERDWVSAIGRKIAAFEQYRRARARHARARGTVLGDFGVQLE